jgi:hypothetical protein
MITERKLIAGTKEELLEYFSFVGNDGETRIHSESISEQLHKIPINEITYVFYLKGSPTEDDGISYSFEMVAVQIRDDSFNNKLTQ